MSATATTQQENISTAVAEAVFATGNLKDLKPAQRVEYMQSACRALGLNPLTRPFRFLDLNGQVQLYATKDCGDQLRRIHKINLHVVDRSIDGDLYTVTVRARTPDGREDEDMGAVNLGQLKGEARANQIMKALTKAKRRVTMSICGLGFLDETEVDTIPGVYTFDAEAEPRQDVVVHGKRPMPPLVRAEEPIYPPRQPTEPPDSSPPAVSSSANAPPRGSMRETAQEIERKRDQKFIADLALEFANAKTEEDANEISASLTGRSKMPAWMQDEIHELEVDTLDRIRRGEQEPNESDESGG